MKQIFTLVLTCTFTLNLLAQSGSNAAPELVFQNPVLKAGIDKKEGAVYRFSNVTSGIDAEVKLKKFSRTDLVMTSVDNPSIGWSKAFQPEFGLQGTVQPNQQWFVDFELAFYKAGTTTRQKLSKVTMTSLDVDGDGNSISEYVVMNNVNTMALSPITYLSGLTAPLLALGQNATCDACGASNILVACNACGGDGQANGDQCTSCDGSGKLVNVCRHAYHQSTTVNGPVTNFTNIDTLSTQVMATFTYLDVDRLTFRYGGKSAANSSNGSGVRMNSLWFRQFSLAPIGTLPVKLSGFTASYDKKNVLLQWTGMEDNFSHYVLQRSTDGRSYSDIAVIFTAGNGQQQQYRYKDQNVSSATNAVFYRLLMVDLTKEGSYSEVKAVRLGTSEAAISLATYPNPVKSEVRVTLPANWQGKPVMLTLYSANGTRMLQKYFGQTGQTESLQLSSLPRGTYVVSAVSEGAEARQTLIKD